MTFTDLLETVTPVNVSEWRYVREGEVTMTGGKFVRIDESNLVRCACARNTDGTATPCYCPLHAEKDPCLSGTGKRRKGSIVRGRCTNCGWAGKTNAPRHWEVTALV